MSSFLKEKQASGGHPGEESYIFTNSSRAIIVQKYTLGLYTVML